MMKIRLFLLSLFLIVFGISFLACGTESDSEGPDPKNTEFPILWPEGGEIITDLREEGGTIGSVTLRYDNDRYQEVVEFYDDYTDEDGWNRSELGQDEVPGINYMNLMEGLNISVGPPDGQIADAFLVTLMVS